MTIEDLWQNLQPYLIDIRTLKEDVAYLKGEVATMKEDIAELKERVTNLEQDVKTLKEDVATLKEDVYDLKVKSQSFESDIKELKENMYAVKEVNLPNILKHQMEMRNELVDMIKKYMEQNEIEHKKFDYKISNLEWHTKIAN